MNIEIRMAKPEDAATIALFNRSMAMETENVQLDEAVTLAGVTAVLEDSHHGFYLIAEVDNKPAGSLLVTREWSDWRNRNKWWIQSVYVLPEYRGKGIFAALYKRVKTEAQPYQVVSFYLYVDKNNTEAQQAYEKVGMKKSHYVMYEDHL